MVAVFYSNWFAHNQKLYSDTFFPVAQSFIFICFVIVEAKLIQNDFMHNSVHDLTLLIFLGVKMHPPKVPRITYVYWDFP